MIQLWNSRLEAFQFEKLGSRLYRRRCDPVHQLVREGKSKQMPGMIQVVLTISIQNEFSTERDELFLISADLQRETPPIEQDFGVGTWWSEKDSDIAFEVFSRFGLAWFEKYSKLRNLRHYFEFVLANGIPVKRLNMPPFVKKLLSADIPLQRRIPPIYRKFASLVCVLERDITAALQYAEEYLKTIPANGDPAWKIERKEMRKQIEFLRRAGHSTAEASNVSKK